jgi:hypothetical protein
MKKFFYSLIAMTFISCANAQTVGIGTTTPDNKAILDIFSPTKGVLIPRINDTSNVTNPLEGMMIYNKNTKAPFYHNGSQWLSLGGRFPSSQQTTGASITYQVSAPGFSGGELPVFSAQVGSGIGVVQPSSTSASSTSEFIFTKELDVNSMGFNLATLQGTLCTNIEFKFYASNASVPYLSYRFQNVYFSGYSVSSGGERPIESISVNFKNYGFKDWVNNVSFGYDVVTHSLTSY